MTDQELLNLYDTIAETVDDEILDEADELFHIGVGPGETMSVPETYYVWVAKTHLERS
tara:strand:+ start:532 stop:705 length:174 start_codon:yes stop_codon:yes gene_type:complete